jgi:hypothetical protein
MVSRAFKRYSLPPGEFFELKATFEWFFKLVGLIKPPRKAYSSE